MHDIKLCRAHLPRWRRETVCVVDAGYQGLGQIHQNTLGPYKASRGRPLGRARKRVNRAVSRLRVKIEQVIGALKRFRILAERYRNRRRRFGLRVNLIAGLYNHGLELPME